jgi:hypothetical protein
VNPEAVFETWAPQTSVWSPWAKPVLFTAMESASALAELPAPGVAWAPDAASQTAIVVDLPGVDAVAVGVALAGRGYRPVPLFNGCHGPAAAVDVMPLVEAIAAAQAVLERIAPAPGAPPAFLLDSRRTAIAPAPGAFDNRWVVLPQDFPSATSLVSHGIRQAVVVTRRPVADDLTHVLLRWQEAGIPVLGISDEGGRAAPLALSRPSQFRSAVHALLARAGLRRSSAGGFGALIPIPPPPGTGGGFA